jgi:hypothetical protein
VTERIRHPHSTAHRAARRAIAHPLAFVALVALVPRLALAIVPAAVSTQYLIPDERQYVSMATAIAHGVSANQWYPGYGQALFDSTWVFSAPLTLMFEVLGPARVIGSLFSAFVGTAVAALTVAIGLRFLRPAFAVGAGVVVALSPSQVLFSSVVLREAHVWLALMLMGLGAVSLFRTSARPMLAGLALAAAGLLALAFLRPQTLLAAAWALALATLLAPRRNYLPRLAAVLAVAAIVPWVGGFGVGGWQLTRAALPRLDATRARLATGANSAFSEPAPPPSRVAKNKAGAEGIVASTEPDKSITSGFSHLPEGVVNVTLRPFPWESSPSLSLALARIETLEWYALYALCALGVVVSVRRRRARLTLQFPIILLALMVGIAAVTQGNLGTAFRHREQVLWVLALGAAAGAEWLWSRRAERRPAVADAHAPVPMSDELPVLSTADNSLSANGR